MEDLSTRAMESIVKLLEDGVEKVPPYVSDLVGRYGDYVFVDHLIWAIIALIALAFGTYYTIKRSKILKLNAKDDYLFGIITLAFLFIVVPLTGVMYNIEHAIEGKLIPEVKLIKDFTSKGH